MVGGIRRRSERGRAMILGPADSRTRRRARREQGMSAVELMERAVHLVREAPAGTLSLYYIGSVPFVLALLYYWSDMGWRGDAAARCAGGALVLAVLFLWMKCWHAAFAQGLRAHLCGQGASRWTLRRVIRMAANQIALQPSGLLAVPGALLVLFPLGWVYAFYQNATALDDGRLPARALARRAGAQARLWPRQNLVVMWVLSPVLLIAVSVFYLVFVPVSLGYASGLGRSLLMMSAVLVAVFWVPLNPLGVILALNVAVALGMIPWLLKSLVGIETLFVQSQQFLLNPMFLAVVCSLVYLALDPFIKAVYAVRCFSGEALRTGEDLRTALRALEPYRRILSGWIVAAAIGALAILGAEAGAAAVPPRDLPPDIGPGLNAPELDRAIAEVLEQREYAWRSPREPMGFEGINEGPVMRTLMQIRDLLARMARAVLRFIRALLDKIEGFFDRMFPAPASGGGGGGWLSALKNIMYVLLAVCVAALVAMAIHAWRKNRGEPVTATPAEMPAAPDLEDESLRPTDMAEDEWIALARDLTARGEFRLAMRAMFLAALSWLARHNFIAVARFKTNRDYLREVARRAHSAPAVLGAFEQCIARFEGVWYGARQATPELAEEFRTWTNRMLAREQDR